MKTLIITLLVFFMAAISYSEAATVKTAKFKCPEMSCAGCKKHITEAVNTLDGITKIDVNLETKIVTVKFDESKTSQDKIKTAIEEAGYSAEKVD